MDPFKTRLELATTTLKREEIVRLQDQISPISSQSRQDLMSKQKARKSAVLILIYSKNGQWHTPLIQRTVYEGKHSGQISLPGGKPEPTDIDLMDTAIRECKEEIGVQVDRTHIFHQLSEVYVPPSNFLITPYLAFMDTELSFEKDHREVAEIIEIPLKKISPKSRTTTRIEVGTSVFQRFPAYHIHEKIIWGATATILGELELLLALATNK